MIPSKKKCPAFNYIIYAEKINRKYGNENLGFLSFERGFMPLSTPKEKLPYPFSIWDQVAKQMPLHYKNQSLRLALKQLPILDANELDDKYLCRASMLMSMLAHAYVRNERKEDLEIPESITIPWGVISKRLKRPQPFLSYIDLIMYNWKVKNSNQEYTLENLELLTPTVNNQEENIFYLTQTEIAFKTKEIVNLVISAQNAIIENNVKEVIQNLKGLTKVVTKVTKSSFLQIDPNPRSKTYVDPVVWAKTVAPFAVPLKEGVQGPSGTSSPFFHLIDTFIERSKYDTILGEEALFIREWYPEHWRNFINAVSEVSIIDYIEKANNEELNGAFYDFVESYAGDKGFLGVHRRKVYGYLQMAFKVGRSVTIGGFSGLFKERTWEEVDDELETTRLERFANKGLKCPYAGVVSKSTTSQNLSKRIVLDVKEKGIGYSHGDRCAVVPKNTKDVVDELLELMNLDGSEKINLEKDWQDYFGEYYNEKKESAPVRQILESAKLNDASGALGMCSHIKYFINTENGELTLKKLIEQLKNARMDVKQFILPYLTTIIKPEQERMYSISSGFKKDQIELVVGDATTVVGEKTYKGVTSSYLHSEEVNENTKIPIKIVRPLRFSLPEKESTIYLFAGGSGIAPFKGFWEELEDRGQLHSLSIFYSVKNESDIVYREELLKLFVEYGVSLDIIITRERKELDKINSLLKNKLIFKSTENKGISDLILEKNTSKKILRSITTQKEIDKGYFYSCGKAGFALSVLESIKEIINLQSILSKEQTQEMYYSLFSENRIMQDIFTSPQTYCKSHSNTFYLSDVISHNNKENGYWVALQDKVYDLTEFKEIHPGGDKIVEDNAGRDATHEFRRANHHTSNEIMSMLTMYCIGKLKKVSFTSEKMKKDYQLWEGNLHLLTEMQNTFLNDFSFKKKKSTSNCKPTEITPYKLALMIENQHRFLGEYVKNILQVFKDLFQGSNKYVQLSILIKEAVKTSIDLKLENIEYKESDFKYRWQELLELENKHFSILNLTRNFLWEGVKLFEVQSEKSSKETSYIFNSIIDNYKIDLEKVLEEENQLIQVA